MNNVICKYTMYMKYKMYNHNFLSVSNVRSCDFLPAPWSQKGWPTFLSVWARLCICILPVYRTGSRDFWHGLQSPQWWPTFLSVWAKLCLSHRKPWLSACSAISSVMAYLFVCVSQAVPLTQEAVTFGLFRDLLSDGLPFCLCEPSCASHTGSRDFRPVPRSPQWWPTFLSVWAKLCLSHRKPWLSACSAISSVMAYLFVCVGQAVPLTQEAVTFGLFCDLLSDGLPFCLCGPSCASHTGSRDFRPVLRSPQWWPQLDPSEIHTAAKSDSSLMASLWLIYWQKDHIIKMYVRIRKNWDASRSCWYTWIGIWIVLAFYLAIWTTLVYTVHIHEEYFDYQVYRTNSSILPPPSTNIGHLILAHSCHISRRETKSHGCLAV